MKCSALLAAVKPLTVAGAGDPDIKGLACDSRKVKPGFLFFALRGRVTDGRQFMDDAGRRGAAAIALEHDPAAGPIRAGAGSIPMLVYADARLAMAELAAAYHRRPGDRLQLVGVTGTNGKTTIAFLVRAILEAAGRRTGLLGTVVYQMGERAIPASRTTPESVDLQDMLSQMVEAGCRSAVLEVSSHALVQHRVAGLDFDAAVFTNLTQDHLDYHETREQYFQAKARLFLGLSRRRKRPAAVINIDDPYGRRLAGLGPLDADLVTVSLDSAADVRASGLRLSPAGSTFDAQTPWGAARVSLPLAGRYNAANALAALAAAGALGVPPAAAAGALAGIAAIPGRLEAIAAPAGFTVYVDYAHTDDALRNVLTALREMTGGRVLTVFGCGGNRDRGKRPLMGAVAEALSDHVILTSDNPRKEDPGEILAQIRAGCRDRGAVEVIEDRQEAIERALSLAVPGDTVLVAGKGHENYQEFADTVIPFDDRQVVRECLGIRHA